MKQLHLEVSENEPHRGRKVYDQKIYVTALERGTRDRSPRRVEPLPDRIELTICPQKNHRGRMKFYRARSIPELCRITLKPTGEKSHEHGQMEEVYITQYTHSFEREIEKPHIVAWKRAFEDSDVAHRDSKLCIVNSPVGSKPGGYPERRRSAPPGSFVFNYDTLDMPEPVHRRSKSLGLYMDDPFDFDSQVGASAGGKIDTKVGESTGGKLRPLAHQMISAQKVEQVESVDLSFWDDAFDSFDGGENYNNSTNSDVRNIVLNDVRNGDVTTNDAMIDDVVTDGVTTNYFRSDVTPDYVSQNGFNNRYDEITHDRDSREDSTQDPAKQALSLISTLRSSVRKPDSETFLRSVHETQTSKTFPEFTSKNRPSLKNQSKEPTFQKFTEQEVLYRNKAPLGTLPRESPQKVKPRSVTNPRTEFKYQTQHEILPRKTVPQETTSWKNLPQEIIPRKIAPEEVLPREKLPQKIAPQEDLPQEKLSWKIAPQEVNNQVGSQLDGTELELKRKYTSKSEANKTISSHATSKADPIHPTSQIPSESNSGMKRKYETKPRLEKLVKITSHSASELSTIGQARIQLDENIPSHSNHSQTDSTYSLRPNTEMTRKSSNPFTSEVNSISPKKTGIQPEGKTKATEVRDTSYEDYENVEVTSSRFVYSKQVEEQVYQTHDNSGFITNRTPEIPEQDNDYYQQPKRELNTIERSETSYRTPSKQVRNHQPDTTSEEVTPGHHQDHYQEPNIEIRTTGTLETKQSSHPDQIANKGYNSQPRSADNSSSKEATREYNEGHYDSNEIPQRITPEQTEQHYQQPKFEEKRTTIQTYPTEYETSENLYEEPKDSTFSPTKCPLDQSDIQKDDKDYKKPLPEIPNERNTSESHYQVPNPSFIRCPLDERKAQGNAEREYHEPLVEHIYEQPNFAGERIYEQVNYETMKAPHPSNLVNTNFYDIPKSENDGIYEQPDRRVYENFNVGLDNLHSKVEYKVVKTSQLKDQSEGVYEKPKDELSSPVLQENITRSEAPAHETLHVTKNDYTKENKHAASTGYSVSSTRTPEFSESLNPEVKYSEDTGSTFKQTDNRQQSTTSLRSKNDLKNDFQNGQSTRVTYTGEVDTKKSVVSTTSSVRIDQSDGRVSESPKSRSRSFEGDLLPQDPEIEVSKETSKRRTRPKARKTQDEEFSQPSIYSITSPSKASYSKASASKTSNTSLARFSSFNSEASYKRRLTSAWIEQQSTNFRKAVSREPSLRRTKSVEFHKERRPSEDIPDYKLKHSKSELSFEQLNAMYEPFNDKYFDVNPDRHPAKVVHTSPSQVMTKAKSLERRVQKIEEPKNLYQVPTRSSKDSLTKTPSEEDAKHTNNESRQQNLLTDENLSRQDHMVTKSEIRSWREPSSLNQQPKPRPKSANVSGFDIRTYNDDPKTLSMEENVPRQDRMPAREVKPSSDQRPRVRPKSADVSGFDITSYNGESRDVSMEESVHKQDGMSTNNEMKRSSNLRPRVRPKSADVSGFDITSYNDEPTLKHSKSELGVDQLKAMYDPYDSWFSPDPVSQNVDQSDSGQVDVTVHEVTHRRSRSQPESRPDRLKSGGEMTQPEPEIKKGKIGKLEAEPVKSITKLDSSSVLVLNVVEVGQKGEAKNPKFKRNVGTSKSMSNIVSVTASEIGEKKHLTMLESKDTRRVSARNIKQTKTGDHTVDGTGFTKGKTPQNDKPIEKLRARYIIGGERASVRYLSKSTDELTSNANDTIKKETSPQLQGQPTEKPVKAPKKDGGFRNFFGKIRRAKSEPNLDKNFNILDMDSDHDGKKQNSQKLKEDENKIHETSPGNSQDSSKHNSNSGLKAKFKYFKKNISKSKQSKVDGSFNDSGVHSGQDISKSEELLESSDFLESDIKRENVELTESQVDVVRPQNIESKIVDSPASSQSVNSAISNQSYTSKSEVPQTTIQIEQLSSSKGKKSNPTSPASPVMSPRSARKRFFQGGNRVTPVTVTDKESERIRRGKEDKTVSKIVLTSQESRGDQERITTDNIVEKNGRITKDTEVFVHTSLPVTSTDNTQSLPEEYGKLDSRRMNDTTIKSSQPRFESEIKSHEDKVRYPSTLNENQEPRERTTSYRITEVSSKIAESSKNDENNSRFTDSSRRREDVKSTALSTTNTVVTHKNNTTYSVSTTNTTKRSDFEENRGAGLNTQMNVGLNGQRNSFHEDSLQSNQTGYVETKDMTVEMDHERDSTGNDLDSKHESLNTKDSKESEIASPKTKHRSFFKTKIFMSVGRIHSSQSKNTPEKKENEESLRESEVSRETEDMRTANTSQNPMKIGKDDVLETSNHILKKEEDNETTSNKSKSKETAKTREVSKEGKKTKNSGQTSREDKEKSEFGTKIKGFITKVLPQKDKSSSKENNVKDETVPGKTKVELERSSDENNNPTTIVAVTSSSNDERKDSEQRVNTSSNNTTKSRRSTFVVKHLGESDSERTRTSEEEGNQVKPGTIELDSSNKNERRTASYISKVKHMGDSNTVKTGSIEKLSVKQSSFDNKRFTTLAANENHTTLRNIEMNGIGKMNATGSIGRKDTSEVKGVQDEAITKTEVVSNVEAFDSIFDLFEKAVSDQEGKDGKDESLSKPEKLETPKSSMMISSSTMYPETNFGVAKVSENKVRRHEEQFARDNRMEQDLVVLNGRGERSSTTEVDLNTTEGKRKDISSNTQTKGNMAGYIKETLDSEETRRLEQIKGFTIKHTKTSSLVLNKSMEENMDSVGKDDGGVVQEMFNTKQDDSRNAKPQSTTMVDKKTEHGTSSPEDENTTEHNSTHGTTTFLVKNEDNSQQEQLKFIEKVMVSVHRGTSDVKRLVRESTEPSNAESSELYSLPDSKPLEHVRPSSGEDNGDRNLKTKYTHKMSAEEAKLTRSSPEKSFGKDIISDQALFPVSKPLERGRSSSGEDNGKMVLTREMPAEDASLTRLNREKNVGITKQEKTRVLNVDEDWGHVVEEFVVKSKEETINALNGGNDDMNESGDELLQLIEEQITLDNTPRQPEDSSTPIQDDRTGNRSKSFHGDLPYSQLNSTVGGSQTSIHTRSKSLEIVDKTDGPRFGKSLDVEETKKFGTSRNATTASGPLMSTTQSPIGTSNSLVKTADMKSSPPPSSAIPHAKNQTRSYSSNFHEEQQTTSSARTTTSLKQQNETVVSTKLCRPKSSLNKETKKAVASTLQENSHLKGNTVFPQHSSVSIENGKYESKNEVSGTNIIPHQKAKQKPPPVLPKPKRNKGKEVSQVNIGDVRHDENHQRKPAGFLDVQNNNLSFVNFQSSQGNYKKSAVKGEQNMFHSTQNYQASGISRESFAGSRVISTERREVSSSVTMKQFKNERMATSETFKQSKNREAASETLRQIESNKEKTSKNVKQRKHRGTTASETSEDLSVRLQRLLCEDDSMSEPEDSSVTLEAASTIYSFSEDSEFDTNLMERRYQSLERPRKTPVTAKTPRNSHITMDESSDEEIFRNNTKLDYRMYSKTL